MNGDCLFCKIVKGEIPSTRVYEDKEFIAFMDIGPIIKGHTLVIPKTHYDPVTETPPDVLARMIKVVQRIAGAQLNGLKAHGVNIIQNNGKVAGQAVPHIHFHIIPRFRDDGHHWNWDAKSYENNEEMKKYADAIRAHCE